MLGVPARIDEQVAEREFHEARIHPDLVRCPFGVPLDPNRVCPGLDRHLLEPGAGRHRLPVHLDVGMIEPCVVEHRGDQVVDLLHVVVHRVELLLEFFIVAVGNHGEREANSRERGAHLVRQRRDQFLLAAQHAAESR